MATGQKLYGRGTVAPLRASATSSQAPIAAPAIQQGAKGRLGSSAWIVFGLAAALPFCAAWAWSARRWSRPVPLLASLSIQAIGIALPTLLGGTTPALVSAMLFGAPPWAPARSLCRSEPTFKSRAP
ncbi:YbfB/YjiJ family MFS transporter [Streptomyces sp. NPDC058286]|uniref:YbfB/YjiJ family MFS transporter n=1 Tax=Streptomyces sp. NPDC058286 TaxID=3346422 RepID=UPI0036E38298